VQAVARVCARILHRSPADLRPGMRFFEDLGMSSFQLLDLAMQLEVECGVFVDEASLHGARTIGALAGLLDSPPGQGCPGSPEIAGHVGA
jgi:acyl carrier protein